MRPRFSTFLDRFTFRSDWRTDIIRQFEHPSYLFPIIPPADFSYARARLSAFRSDVEWLIVFEMFGFDSEAGSCGSTVFAFGNKLRRKRQLTWGPEFTLVNKMDKPLSLDSSELLQNLDPTNFRIEVDGEVYHFTPTPADYAELSITLASELLAENEDVAAVHLLTKTLRYVAYTAPEIVFFQPKELLKNLGRPETLSLFLQTFDWHHPYEHKDDTPSNSPCLQSLTVALADNDINAFHCPQSTWNTHWSHWPEWPN